MLCWVARGPWPHWRCLAAASPPSTLKNGVSLGQVTGWHLSPAPGSLLSCSPLCMPADGSHFLHDQLPAHPCLCVQSPQGCHLKEQPSQAWPSMQPHVAAPVFPRSTAGKTEPRLETIRGGKGGPGAGSATCLRPARVVLGTC